ncbi:MAG: cyclase family protein [Candidatus Methylomirabilales bacterium]
MAKRRKTSMASGHGLLERVLTNRARIVDLTYPLSETTQHWPGGVPFRKELAADYDKGYRKFTFSMGEDVGTHIDAPAHFFRGGLTIDKIPLERLIGPAAVLDVRRKVARAPDYCLTIEDLQDWEETHGRIPRGSVVILHTGWGSRWQSVDRYRNMDREGVMHFPGFSGESATFLLRRREIVGIGIDTLSLDFGGSRDFPAHQIMLKAGKFQIENLANVGQLPPSGAVLFAIPLKIVEGPESEGRVFALVP